jgi:hypothetical protein
MYLIFQEKYACAGIMIEIGERVHENERTPMRRIVESILCASKFLFTIGNSGAEKWTGYETDKNVKNRIGCSDGEYMCLLRRWVSMCVCFVF